MSDLSSLSAWQQAVRREYPAVRFETTERPAGVNAVCEGVLVGRYFSERDRPYGVIYAQPRSCGGKPF